MYPDLSFKHCQILHGLARDYKCEALVLHDCLQVQSNITPVAMRKRRLQPLGHGVLPGNTQQTPRKNCVDTALLAQSCSIKRRVKLLSQGRGMTTPKAPDTLASSPDGEKEAGISQNSGQPSRPNGARCLLRAHFQSKASFPEAVPCRLTLHVDHFGQADVNPKTKHETARASNRPSGTNSPVCSRPI